MKKILIVDDSLEYLNLLTFFLVKPNRQIYSATCGRDAIKLMELEKVDLIISDLQMPDGDGLWLLKELKMKNLMAPVIILSSDIGVTEKELLQEGALRFFSKPLDLSDFERFLVSLNF